MSYVSKGVAVFFEDSMTQLLIATFDDDVQAAKIAAALNDATRWRRLTELLEQQISVSFSQRCENKVTVSYTSPRSHVGRPGSTVNVAFDALMRTL